MFSVEKGFEGPSRAMFVSLQVSGIGLGIASGRRRYRNHLKLTLLTEEIRLLPLLALTP